MKSITIHGIDDTLAGLIQRRSAEEKISQNRLIKRILEEAFGMRVSQEYPHREDFAEFKGLWTAEERAQFEQVTGDMRQVDEDDWR